MDHNYEAYVVLENGLQASEKFDDYIAMCRWLAAYSAAGISAYDIDAREAVLQCQLQEDVTHYQE